MKFTDGYWQLLPGVEVLRPRQVVDLEVHSDSAEQRLVVHASTALLRTRGDTLNRPLLNITFTAPADGVIAVRIEHHTAAPEPAPLRGGDLASSDQRRAARAGRPGRGHFHLR